MTNDKFIDMVLDLKEVQDIFAPPLLEADTPKRIFKAATAPELGIRRDQLDKVERDRLEKQEQRERERIANRAAWEEEQRMRKAKRTNLPYTYEQIKELPVYQEIVALPNVTDATTPLQALRRTVRFDLIYQEITTHRGNWRAGVTYTVYPHGYIRRQRLSAYQADPSIAYKGTYANTIEEYTELLERLRQIILHKINLDARRGNH